MFSFTRCIQITEPIFLSTSKSRRRANAPSHQIKTPASLDRPGLSWLTVRNGGYSGRLLSRNQLKAPAKATSRGKSCCGYNVHRDLLKLLRNKLSPEIFKQGIATLFAEHTVD